MKTILAIALLGGIVVTSASLADDKAQERARATGVLKRLESHVTKVSTDALFQMLYTDVNSDTMNPAGSMYYVMRDGNECIKKELVQRVSKDRAIIEGYLKDKRSLFTGHSGPRETVGHVCEELLKEEPAKSNKALRGR